MKRFIMTHRCAGKKDAGEHRRARDAMLETLETRLRSGIEHLLHNGVHEEPARHIAVMDADEDMICAECTRLDDDVLIEPHMPHYVGRVRPPEVGPADEEELAASLGSGQSTSVLITDEDGSPLSDVDVFAYFGEGDNRRQLAKRTSADGRAQFEYSAEDVLTDLAVVPKCDFWSMIHCGEADHLTFACPRLPQAQAHLGWWHQLAGIDQFDDRLGAGMKIGVIDTGVGPHRNLDHVQDIGALIDAELDEHGGADIRGHGSHVCGILGAKPMDATQFGGLVPGAALSSMRVFGATGGAHQGDIALAIWAMAHQQQCHLVNMSLGTASRSEIERDAIVDALEQGCLCICAAGNTSGASVNYPAAFDEAVAITALGEKGWGPVGSLAAHRIPAESDRFGSDSLYLANFSGHGATVDATGAGVGLISTVPATASNTAPYAAFGGTSMATPYVTGILSTSLAEDAHYAAMGHEMERAQYARERLAQISRDIGLRRDYQGVGLPVRVRR